MTRDQMITHLTLLGYMPALACYATAWPVIAQDFPLAAGKEYLGTRTEDGDIRCITWKAMGGESPCSWCIFETDQLVVLIDHV